MKNIAKIFARSDARKEEWPCWSNVLQIYRAHMTNMLDRGGSAKLSSSSVDIA